jgi:hypothetical protein
MDGPPSKRSSCGQVTTRLACLRWGGGIGICSHPPVCVPGTSSVLAIQWLLFVGARLWRGVAAAVVAVAGLVGALKVALELDGDLLEEDAHLDQRLLVLEVV